MTWLTSLFSGHFTKTTALVLVLLPFAAGGILYKLFVFPHAPAPLQPVLPLTINISHDSDLNKDSDDDGLRDWEEALYGTDPHNKDTDRDGVSDGEEVATGHDPLKPGPDDLTTHITDAIPKDSPQDADVTVQKENLTRDLAKRFSEVYLPQQLKNLSQPIDPREVAADFTDFLASRSTPSKIYTTDDIRLVPDTSRLATESYLKQLNTAVSAFLTAIPPAHALKVFALAAQNQKLTDILPLDPDIKAYETLIQKLASIPVPSDFADLAIQYLNTTVKEYEAVKRMRDPAKDIFAALMGVRQYMTTADDFEKIRLDMVSVYQRKLAPPK